mgnify:CR=1 FL=1
MNSVARLIKAKTISFTEEILKNFKKINLNEIETILLIKLYQKLDNHDDLLSIEELVYSMTLNEEELSNLVIKLVQKGFIEINLENGVESFSIDGTIELLAKAIDDDEPNTFKDRQDLLSQIVLYIETTYAKPLAPADLMIINNWIDLSYSFDEIKKAILDSLKAKKLHLKYADAILANRSVKEKRETVEYDEEIKRMLDAMYAKK